MAKWTMHSYWLFVNGVREAFGVSTSEARAIYRAVSDRLDRPVFGVDLERHPRVAREEARAVQLEAVERAAAAEEERRARLAEQRAERRRAREEVYYEEPIEYEEFEFTATYPGAD